MSKRLKEAVVLLLLGGHAAICAARAETPAEGKYVFEAARDLSHLNVTKPDDLARYKAECGLIMQRPLRIGRVETSTDGRRQGRRLELTFGLDATYDSPFDPDDVRIDGVITCPGGRKLLVPAFFYTMFERRPDGSVGRRGQPLWKVRFTPREAGTYTYRITARDRNGTAESPAGTFVCRAGRYAGFLRVSARQPKAFEDHAGKAFMPIGLNLLRWQSTNKPNNPARVPNQCARLERLSENGANLVRLRGDCHYNPIEGAPSPKGKFLGMGWYNQEACWEIDRIYERAEAFDVFIMHCLHDWVLLRRPPGNTWWQKTNYILEQNGGPCSGPWDFFTDEDARGLVRRKLRYVVARWGYSPNLMAWELINEGKSHDGRWEEEMAGYLKSIDFNQHMVSTGMHGHKTADSPMWALAAIDFTQDHAYDKGAWTTYLTRWSRYFTRTYSKPFLVGEIGLHGSGGTDEAFARDPEGVGMHNQIWSAALAGGAGVLEWFGGKVEQYGLYGQYRLFSEWAEGVRWNHPERRPLAVENVRSAAPRGRKPKELVFSGKSVKDFEKSPVERFRVNPETFEISDIEHLQLFLHCGKGRKTRPTFILDCAGTTEFRVLVAATVGDDTNALRIHLDKRLVKTEPFPADKGAPDKWQNRTVQYRPPRAVGISVPKGRHEVMVEAVGKDRLAVQYQLKGYFTGSDPAEVLGLRTRTEAWLWVHNSRSTHANRCAGVEPSSIEVVADLVGLEDGEYDVRWYDCWQGRDVCQKRATCTRGRMRITTPPLSRDIAGKLRRR